MDEAAKKLKILIEGAGRILVVSHISPDPDALCSLLLMGTALKENFPDKQIAMSSEELTSGLDFLTSYQDIEVQPLETALDKYQPDMIVMLDAMNFQRCTRGDYQTVAEKIKSKSTRLVIIDHHQPEAIETNDLYINSQSPAATQDVYEILFKRLEFKKPNGYAQTSLLGIISDTNRFMYDNPRHRDTFDIIDELLDAGASIEDLENKRNRFSQKSMLVLSELARNIVVGPGYSYTFIGDDFKRSWFESGNSPEQLKLGCQVFVNDYIRNIEDNNWGFMVYPDMMGGANLYSASFRSVSGSVDVADIAKKLGGGGHKASAGAKFEAASVEEATNMVIAVIAR